MPADSRDTPDQLEEALVALFESQMQAGADFCGQQREWHLPRLNRAVMLLMRTFPKQSARALMRVMTPYGTKAVADD